MLLHVEILDNEQDAVPAVSVATFLALPAFVTFTLNLKKVSGARGLGLWTGDGGEKNAWSLDRGRGRKPSYFHHDDYERSLLLSQGPGGPRGSRSRCALAQYRLEAGRA
jgi:hypothetical protein